MVVLVTGARVIGFSKTAIGGLVMVAVGLFAAVLPAKPSTGVALLLLIPCSRRRPARGRAS